VKQEPAEASGWKNAASAVGILAACGGEDVKKCCSICKDWKYASFVSRLASSWALFAIGYLLQRFIRSKLDSRKGRLSSRRMTRR